MPILEHISANETVQCILVAAIAAVVLAGQVQRFYSRHEKHEALHEGPRFSREMARLKFLKSAEERQLELKLTAKNTAVAVIGND